jgi:hypothetical protein
VNILQRLWKLEREYFFGPQEVTTIRKASRLIDAIAAAYKSGDLEQVGKLLEKEGAL